MNNKKSSESRRKLLKSIAAGSGVIVAGKSLPESWSRPVVDSVLLPVHALTSGNTLEQAGCSAPAGCYGMELLEAFISWPGGAGPVELSTTYNGSDCTDPSLIGVTIVLASSLLEAADLLMQPSYYVTLVSPYLGGGCGFYAIMLSPE